MSKNKSLASFKASLVVDEEPQFDSVKTQSLQDPPLGCPLRIVIDGVEKFIEPGEWRGEAFVNEFSNLPDFMPVTALGVDGEKAYFLNTQGQIVALGGKSGKGDFELLFAGRINLLNWLWPRWNDKAKKIDGWHADHCKQALWNWAGYCGMYNGEEAIRGRGMWRDAKGGLVFHAGDAVYINGKWERPGFHDGNIYIARQTVGKPAHNKIDQPGRLIFESLKTWYYARQDIDPILLLGWIVTAKMGAALFRRPILWLLGSAGVGKSYLQTFIRALMHEALMASSNATPAAIFQTLAVDCVPVCLDEQESKEDSRSTDRLFEIMRASYSGDSLNRGDKDGNAKKYPLRSSFLCSSIGMPPTQNSDDTRMAIIQLMKAKAIQAKEAYTEAEAYKWGQALTRRIMHWWPRWDTLLNMVSMAMKQKAGHSSRSLDTFAPLIAGFHLATEDELPSVKQLEAYASMIEPKKVTELQARIDDWERCLRHLLGTVPDAMKTKTKKTIGAVIQAYFNKEYDGLSEAEISDKLADAMPGMKIGIKYRKGEARQPSNAYLFIPVTDAGLTELFQGTPWAGNKASKGPWALVLRQAPLPLWGEKNPETGQYQTKDEQFRFNGVNCRGLAFNIEKTLAFINATAEQRETFFMDDLPPEAQPLEPIDNGQIDF